MIRMTSEVRGDVPDFLNGSKHFFSLNQEGSNFNHVKKSNRLIAISCLFCLGNYTWTSFISIISDKSFESPDMCLIQQIHLFQLCPQNLQNKSCYRNQKGLIWKLRSGVNSSWKYNGVSKKLVNNYRSEWQSQTFFT